MSSRHRDFVRFVSGIGRKRSPSPRPRCLILPVPFNSTGAVKASVSARNYAPHRNPRESFSTSPRQSKSRKPCSRGVGAAPRPRFTAIFGRHRSFSRRSPPCGRKRGARCRDVARCRPRDRTGRALRVISSRMGCRRRAAVENRMGLRLRVSIFPGRTDPLLGYRLHPADLAANKLLAAPSSAISSMCFICTKPISRSEHWRGPPPGRIPA